jgi:hypothetical protein
MAGTEQRDTYWSPSRNYEISCKVGKFDLTNDLIQINIITSVEIPYRTFILDFFLDPDDMILEKIYGQEPIQMKIKVFGAQESIPQEIIQTNLMALGSKHDLLMKDSEPQIPDKIRASIRIRAVPIESYRAMTSYVNGIYFNSTLREVVTDLASKCGAQLLMDDLKENITAYDQILVPPSPFYKALKYLDRTFGFFNGLAGIYGFSTKVQRTSNSGISADIKSRIYITNMSESKKFSNFTITQLSTDNPNQDKLVNVFDGKTFYTHAPVETEYVGNTIFSMYGSKMKHIVKPRDSLYNTIEINTKDFANEFGITTKKNQIFYSEKGQGLRTSVFKDHSGYDDVETHIRSIHSKYFAQMSVLKVRLQKWLILENLINVGQGVIFRSNIRDVRDLTGNYVLKFSHVQFTRPERDWECGVTLHLIRTNRVN